MRAFGGITNSGVLLWVNNSSYLKGDEEQRVRPPVQVRDGGQLGSGQEFPAAQVRGRRLQRELHDHYRGRLPVQVDQHQPKDSQNANLGHRWPGTLPHHR